MLIGIIGKPNCGKSTFFKATTLAEVEIATYPFTTIKPNHGIGYVKAKCIDNEFNVKCQPKFGYCINGWRFIPIDIIDVAGLVPKAHLGKGRGNQFLDDLRQAHVFIHVIDISGSLNAHGEPIEKGSYDPAKDIRFLETELDMWFFQILKKKWDKFAKQIQQEKILLYKELAKQLSGLGINEERVKEAVEELKLNVNSPVSWNEEQLKELASLLRKKNKPMIIACNKIDIPGSEEKFLKLKEQFPDYCLTPCSAESELALKEAAKHGLISYVPGSHDFKIIAPDRLNEKQKSALNFIKKNILRKWGSTGIQKILDKAVFDLLNYIIAYPVENENKLTDKNGNVLPDALLLKNGSTALNLAYKIHSDIGDKFSSAIDAKTKKHLKKDYVLENNDVIKIL